MSDFDEDRSVCNGLYEVEVVVDRPAKQVWQQFLDLNSWIVSHRIELVAGTQDGEGAITRVSPKRVQEGTPLPHHHYCKIIKLVPERQYVLKTYSEKGGSYGAEMAAFDDTRFEELNGKTRVTFNIYAQRKVPGNSSSVLNLEASREGMRNNLNNLKRIVESR